MKLSGLPCQTNKRPVFTVSDMYWEETEQEQTPTIPDRVVDLVFAIKARTLPVDHAYALSQAIIEKLTWLQEEPLAGVHTIHVAESANGWFRPNNPEQVLYPSRRTKLTIRVPKHRIDDAKVLSGQSLDIAGHVLTIDKVSIRPLSDITTLFSRNVMSSDCETEEKFVQYIVAALSELNIRPKKMLCGTEKMIQTPEGKLRTRSLMLADLTFEQSIGLQEQGLSTHRHMGCGIFLPHKDINKIRDDQG